MLRPSLLAALAAALTGCVSDYPETLAAFRASHEAGDFAGAALQSATAAAEGGPSVLLWTLEEGATQRAAGNLPAATEALGRAAALLDAIDAAPEVSLSGEALSAFSNPYELLYRGRNLDRTLSATLLALCHLEAGEPDKARVALTRAMFHVDDARRIADARVAIASEEADAAAGEDEDFRARLSSDKMRKAGTVATAGFRGLPTYAGFVNPLTNWVHGVFLLHTAEGPADVERARKSLQIAAALSGSAAVAADLALAEAGKGRPDPGEGRMLVYVLQESGSAPRWHEESVTLPLIWADPAAPIVNVAFPAVRPSGADPGFIASSIGDTRLTEPSLLASVDAMVLAEFREEWPIFRNRAIASATVKAVAAYIANKAAEEYARQNSDDVGAQFLMLATLVGTNLYTATAQADLRHWSSLPSSYRLQRGEAPAGSRLSITGAGLAGPREVVLPDAKAVLVTVRTVASGVAPSVRVCILQPR